jgi:hypothetical protein
MAQVAICIRDRISDSFEREAGVPLRQRLDGVVVTAGAGESIVSLEILCSNLDEFDVPLQASEYALLLVVCLQNKSPRFARVFA